jgi:hypothetical protein
MVRNCPEDKKGSYHGDLNTHRGQGPGPNAPRGYDEDFTFCFVFEFESCI